VELTKIHRNAGDIVRLCHRIKKQGEYDPYTIRIPFSIKELKHPDHNLVHIEESDPAKIQWAVAKIVSQFVPDMGYDPLWDCQVLSATNDKHQLSCKELNDLLQSKFVSKPEQGFAEGDKCIQIKNEVVRLIESAEEDSDEETQVYNGDLCQIGCVDKKNYGLEFFYPDRYCVVPRFDANLRLAYAITCHKFQGSEAKVVIIPVHHQDTWLTKNWIYTAISRAEDLCITIGRGSVIKKAVYNQERHRITNKGRGLFSDAR
jgi:exodeoxyribonuclease V alpha subunit